MRRRWRGAYGGPGLDCIVLEPGRAGDPGNRQSIQYGQYCFRIAKNILLKKEDSEECVNDTYLRVWNAIPEDRPRLFSAYIGRITRNLARNRYEKQHAQKRGAGEIPMLMSELRECIANADSVTQQLEQKEITQVICRVLATLPPTQQSIFLRRYWYAESIAAIARDYRYGQSKVKSILFRCRKQLKPQLEQEGIQ